MSDALLPPLAEPTGALFASLDARSRLLAAIVLVIALAATHTFSVLAFALAAAAILAASAGAFRWPGLRRRLVHAEGFLVLLFILLPFTMPGPALLALGPLEISTTGLARAGEIALRINACALVLLAFLGGLEAVSVGHALARLGAPRKLVHLFLFCVRYVDVLSRETRRLIEAMRARAFRPTWSIHGMRSYGHLVGMVVVRALERAERIDEAMRCRGYRGLIPLETMGRWSWRDSVAVGLASLAALALLTADRLA